MTLIFCPRCSRHLPDKATTCAHCGHPIAPVARRKSGAVAAAWTLMYPGLGHIYCGEANRGILWIVVMSALYWFAYATGSILVLVIAFSMTVGCAVEAIRIANRTWASSSLPDPMIGKI